MAIVDYDNWNFCSRCQLKVDKERKWCPHCQHRVRTGSRQNMRENYDKKKEREKNGQKS